MSVQRITVQVDPADCISRELTARIADSAMHGNVTIAASFIRRYAITRTEFVLACEVAEACGLEVVGA
jgi:hypothetical protein